MAEQKKPATVREIINALTESYVDMDRPLAIHVYEPGDYWLTDNLHCTVSGQCVDVEATDG